MANAFPDLMNPPIQEVQQIPSKTEGLGMNKGAS